jgi:hypothetical protein
MVVEGRDLEMGSAGEDQSIGRCRRGRLWAAG